MTAGVYDTDRQVNYLMFVGTVVGMVLLAMVLLAAIGNMKANHGEDAISRRAKFAACSSIENEPTRIVCMNGWSR